MKSKFFDRARLILKTPIDRKAFLSGLGGLLVGGPLGAAVAESVREEDPEGGRLSYAQGGEDVAADFFFQYIGLKDITYLDIGAYHPVKINNTFFFYRKGNKGVLVEPNSAMCERLRSARPRDTTLEAGVGVSNVKEADYYVMTDVSWNTFSKEEALHQEEATNKRIRIRRVVKMPLLNINDVMDKHFGKAPAYLSIDAEGLHFAILKSIDFKRFRPPLICVETLVSGTRKTISEIPSFMEQKGYVPRGGSFVNTLFVDSKLL